jgi:tetratricopeptide (TPR) repeat protein
LIGGTSCTLELADAAAWRACAGQFHADAIVSGTLSTDRDPIAVELAVDRIDGTRLGRITAHAAPTSITALVRRHAHQIADLVAGRLSGDIAVDPDLDLGIDSLHQSNYTEAHRLFAAVLARSPDQPDALYYDAIASSWQNAPDDEVDAAFERALAAKLTPVQDGIVRGFGLIHHRELEQSIAHFRKLAAEFPDHPLVLYGLCEALFHGGYPADGIAAYRQLAEVDRDFRLGLMHPFDFYVIRGDVEGATWTLGRNQRFGVRNLVEWQTRLRVLGGDLSGAYAALLAEDGEAVKRGTPRPYELGVVALAIAREDRELIARTLKTPLSTPAEIAIGMWRGDRAIARHGFERQASGARSRGRRGVYDIARIVPLISLSEDDKLVADALAVIDQLAKGDPKLGVNEVLGRVFLLGRLRDRAGLTALAKSAVPEVARVASAFLAGIDGDGKRVRDDWQQAFALSADGQFVMAGKAHLAAALHAAGDHAGVLATCGELLEPRIVDLAVGPATVPCLVWSAEALERTRPDQAIAMYKRVLTLRSPTDHHHATAAAALRRLVR